MKLSRPKFLDAPKKPKAPRGHQHAWREAERRDSKGRIIKIHFCPGCKEELAYDLV